jgi:hypothetical protein
LEIFLGDIVDCWVKDIRYTLMWSQIQLTSTVMEPVWQRTVGSTTSGGGMYSHDNFAYEGTSVNFLWNCCQLCENSGYQITRRSLCSAYNSNFDLFKFF